MADTSQRPVKTFTHGALQLAIWKNHRDGKAYYSGTMNKRYNANKGTGDADWRSTESIPYLDMPAAAMLWQRAANYIAFQKDK